MPKRKTTDEFKKEVYNLVGEKYTVLGEYINCHTKILFKDNNCGKTFKMSPTHFLEGERCFKSSKNNLNIVEDSNIKYKSYKNNFIKFIKSFYKDNIIIKNNGYDLYLNKENILISYIDLYKFSEKFKDNNYLINKMKKYNEKNIRVINVFEDEYINKKKLIKLKLRHILNIDNKEKIYARKCYIKEISTDTKNKFLNKNHIQGADNSNIKLGLFYQNILMAVITFCKPRISLGQRKSNNSINWELSRYASNIHYRVIGGFGKLFSYFKNNYEFNSIITYADLRWSIGNLYHKVDFKLDHISKPNYWYIKKGIIKREYRFKYRKQNLKKLFPNIYSNNKSEREIMQEAGYLRIYDCGNLVFIYNK